jgi:hypothetical protein
MGLAISPENALVFSIDQIFAAELELGGRRLAGTDRQSTLLGQRYALRVNAGVGLTDDAPDYRLGDSGARFRGTIPGTVYRIASSIR